MKKSIFFDRISPKKLSKSCVMGCTFLSLFVFLFAQTYAQGWQSRFQAISGNPTVPDNVYAIKVEAWGGGGAGGYAKSFKIWTIVYGQNPSSGGGGGAFASEIFTVTPGSTYTVTVGNGGTNTGTPINGGNSSVVYGGVTKVLAVGGNTAISRSAYNDSKVAGQGGQASACIGSVKYSGGNGSECEPTASGAFCKSGAGGAAAKTDNVGNNASAQTGGAGFTFNSIGDFGKGGNGKSSILGEVYAGSNYGGGGGGSISAGLSNSSYSGGAGAPGVVYISYYMFTPGAISGEQTICQCTTPDAITNTAAQGTNPVYQWYVSIDGAEAVAIDGATSQNYTPSATYTATPGIYLFTRKAKDDIVSNYVDCEGSYTLTVTKALEQTGVWPNDSIISPSDVLDANLLKSNDDIKALYTSCVTVTSADVTSTDACGPMITRTFTIQDACGNSLTKTQKLRQGENNAPSFTCPADRVVTRIVPNANYNIDPSVTGRPTNLSDDATPVANLVVEYTDAVVGTETPNAVTVINRTWTVTDNCGNTAIATQEIRIMPAMLPSNTTLICPADIDADFYYGACDTALNLGTATYQTETEGLTFTITNNATITRYSVGTYTVTWTITDQYGFSLSCDQNITVNYPECTTATDFEGNTYSAVRIGCECWLATNLKSTKYSDGTDVAKVFDYREDETNAEQYGKLYTWYSANRVTEDDNAAVPTTATAPDGHTYVQGICPSGWALPTVANYQHLIAFAGNADRLKDSDVHYWLPEANGVEPNIGFDVRGAGYYDASIDRYFNLLGQTYLWTSDVITNVWGGVCCSITHSCPTGLIQEEVKSRGQSVRCIRVF